ncbi:sperm microtubule associated protein 2 [Cetorhinus maximus]
MKAKPTSRTEELAKPKAINKDFDSTRSIYTEGKSKTAKRGKGSRRKKERITYAETPRYIYLSEPKKLPEGYLRNRPSPTWPVSRKTMRARPSSRIYELAKPKQLHKKWQPSRSAYSEITEDVLYAVSSTRTDQLAQHKIHIDPPVRKSYLWDYPYWDHEISEEAKTVSPTERIIELASKKLLKLSV